MRENVRFEVCLPPKSVAALEAIIECNLGFHEELNETEKGELVNLANECRARLQHYVEERKAARRPDNSDLL